MIGNGGDMKGHLQFLDSLQQLLLTNTYNQRCQLYLSYKY